MRVFVTGANGWIGSSTVRELLAAGHEVVGMARSEEGLAKIAELGATPLRGTLEDHEVMQAAAADSDGVIHLAYVHDFSSMEAISDAAMTDRAATEAMAKAIEGSGRPLLIASGVLGLGTADRLALESDQPDSGHPRQENAAVVLALADRGIRPGVVRLPPTVHGEGDTGFIASIAGVAKDKGFAGYLGDGSTCWSAVHRDDAATLFRLAIEQESASGVLHAVADEAVPLRQIAELIGRQLGLPVEPVTDEAAGDHFGWLAFVLSMDGRASSAHTRELLGWQPTRPTLVDDLEAGYYTS